MLRIEFETDNAAFEGDDLGPECARILRKIAGNLAGAAQGNEYAGAILDSNGNRVGGLTLVTADGGAYLEIGGVPDAADVDEDTRQGCAERVCWCHVDPRPLGFHCSDCGCVIVAAECPGCGSSAVSTDGVSGSCDDCGILNFKLRGGGQ